MSISKIENRDSIIKAIQGYDRVGEERYLKDHGFGKAKRYHLKYRNKLYASKAIVGVAHGFEFPNEPKLTANDFNGGERTVQKLLERLGFTVVVLKKNNK
jgi:hypothetical protein